MNFFHSLLLLFLLPLAVTAQSLQIQDGAILAEFSVSDSRKVYFSHGNLQYRASTKTWRFAEHQWDFVGTQEHDDMGNFGGNVVGSDNVNASKRYDGWIDLFGWGTSGYKGKKPYMTSVVANDYGDDDNAEMNFDWGVYNKISNGVDENKWRTLTHEEWDYLFYERPRFYYLYALGTVNDVKGLIVLPDNWSMLESPKFIYHGSYAENVYSVDEWLEMESKGAVFFPAAGCRAEGKIVNVTNDGFYWSKTTMGDGVMALAFDFDVVCEPGTERCPKYYGLSVRLVQDVKK